MPVNPQRRPARPAPRSFAVDQPTLLQFVLLSMLLHVLLIVLFGNPAGVARRSEGWPGPLDVTLRRVSPEPGSSVRLTPGAGTSTPDLSLRRRAAGPAEANRLERTPAPVNAPEPTRDAAPPARPPPAQALPQLNRAPEEVDKPLTPPAVAPAKIEHIAPPQIERELAPPVELPPRAVPAAPAAPLERIAPASIEREIAAPAEIPAPRREPATAAPPLPRTAPTPAAASRFGTPDADEEIFKSRRDVATPPSEAPRIDLDAARKKAAREIVREGSGSRGVFSIPSPPPLEKKSKEAMAMEKAIKPDCRTAYANMGLLAVPVLVASAIAADGSCRW